MTLDPLSDAVVEQVAQAVRAVLESRAYSRAYMLGVPSDTDSMIARAAVSAFLKATGEQEQAA